MTMTINGSGTIAGLQPGGLPDASVQQADLAANTVGNGPAFSAQGGTTSVANASSTVLVPTTINFDTANAYSTVTGKFQPNVPGYYQFNASVGWAGSTTVSGKTVSLRKNNADFSTTAYSTSDTGPWESASLSGMAFLNGTTDFVTVNGYISSGGPATPNTVYFSGFLARAA